MGVSARSRWGTLAAAALPCLGTGCDAQGQSPTTPALTGGATLVAQWPADDRVRPEVTGSLDVFVELPLGRGRLFTYIEGNTSPRAGGVAQRLPAANTDAGTALSGDGSGRIQLSELRVVWPVSSAGDVHLGLLDATGFLDVSRIANDENLFFLGLPFVNNPTIAFPDYAPAVAYDGALPGGALRVGAVVSSSHGLADNPSASYSDLADVGAGGKGVFAGATARCVGVAYRLSAGAWHDSASRPFVDGSARTGTRHGIFTVLGWDRGRHAFSVRAGVRGGNVSNIRSFLGGTYLWSRSPGAVGLALGRSLVAASLPTASDQTHGELFLRARLPGGAFVTASAQHLTNPAFDPSGTVLPARLWVLGVRLSTQF